MNDSLKNLCNLFEICVIGDFWHFPEISNSYLDNLCRFCETKTTINLLNL